MSDLLAVVTDSSSTQADVVTAYATSIRESTSGQLMVGTPWAEANAAIIERWDEDALREIKRAAWAVIDDERRRGGLKLAEPPPEYFRHEHDA